MNWKEITLKYSKQAQHIQLVKISERVYALWWKNSRSKATGGLRLTDDGITFLKEKLQIQTYDVPFPMISPTDPKSVIFLDKYIDCLTT